MGWERRDSDDEKVGEVKGWIMWEGGDGVGKGVGVIWVNGVGEEGDGCMERNGMEFWGKSFVVGGEGEFLGEGGNEEGENIVVEVDLEGWENVGGWWGLVGDGRIEGYEGLRKGFLE